MEPLAPQETGANPGSGQRTGDGRAPPRSMHTSPPSPGRSAVTTGANRQMYIPRTKEKRALADLGVSTPGEAVDRGVASGRTAGLHPGQRSPASGGPGHGETAQPGAHRSTVGRATGAPTFGKSTLGGSGPSCHPSEGQRWTDRPVLRDYARLCTARCQEVASTLESWAGGSQSPHTQGPQGGPACERGWPRLLTPQGGRDKEALSLRPARVSTFVPRGLGCRWP